MLTQRQRPRLALVTSAYDLEKGRLSLTFPEGQVATGAVNLGEPVHTRIWGRPVSGRLLEGPWNEALSLFCGGPVRVVKTDDAGDSFDEYPLSLLSQASIEYIARRTAGAREFEARRFRPNFLIDGCDPHDEDFWLGGLISVGPALRLRVVAPDPRCAITTVDPDTGQRDFDMPRFLLTYRPGSRAPYFGVYATVETPGEVSVGDHVELFDGSS